MLIFMAVLILAIGFWAGRPSKPYRRKMKIVRVGAPSKDGGCSTCGGNCGQCGSSH